MKNTCRPGAPLCLGISACLMIGLFAGCPYTSALAADEVERGAFAEEETLEHRDERLEWWREARYGMFVHWGLYSVIAGEWDGKPIPGLGSWSMHTAGIDPAEYARLKDQFNPTRYDPKQIARLAKRAGMRYVVLTTKHHDGFCLFDSEFTDYDIMSTPYKRDIVRDYVKAVRDEGLKVGFYFSIIDWTHPHHPVKGDPNHPMRENPDYLSQERDPDIYLKYMHSQVRELLTNYGRIDLLWLDFHYGQLPGDKWRRDMVKMARQLQPGIIINNRLGYPVANKLAASNPYYLGDFSTPEGIIPTRGDPDYDMEVCMTIGDSWGYKKSDTNLKSAEQLIQNLADIAGKGGNYLLNIGPRADGTLQPLQVERVEAIGEWMKTYGESIYGTSANVFERAPRWGRCTVKQREGGTTRLYLHVFDWPADGKLRVPLRNDRLERVYLLADPERTSLETVGTADGIVVEVGAEATDEVDSVVVVDVCGKPDVVPFRVTQGKDGQFRMRPEDADLHGNNIRQHSNGGSPSIGYWGNKNDWVSWPLKIDQGGTYRVLMTYGCPAPKDGGRSEYVVQVAGQEINARSQDTGGWFDLTTDDIGKVTFEAGSSETLAIRIRTLVGQAPMDLARVELVPEAIDDGP